MAKKGTTRKRLSPSSPKLGHLREKICMSPYIATRKGFGRTDMCLGVLMTNFLPLFCFAASIDFKDTFLGVNTVARDDSLPRKKLWLTHQFKTTRTVTAGHRVTEKEKPD